MSKKLIRDFIKCGICGWCMEITFTALKSLRHRDLKLSGNTSLWMFPVYGCAVLLKPAFWVLKQKPFWFRGSVYAAMIFSGEYSFGKLLQKHNLCPWNYCRSHYQVNDMIRLDFFPLWFGAGLLFEKLLCPSPSCAGKDRIN